MCIRDRMKAYGLFDFMMKKVWSLPPASPQAGLIRSANWVGLTDSRSDEYFPASSLPPVLAGIRASKSLHFAFPCKLHSGLLKWSARINPTLVYRCGGSTRWWRCIKRIQTSCFPFNCTSRMTHEHQNNLSVVQTASIRQLWKNIFTHSFILLS